MGLKLSQDSSEPISEINVTPFVDIILVVLIIFMVSAPLFLKPSINVNLPKAVSGQDTKKGKFNVGINKAGDLLLNGQTSSMEKIAEFARTMVRENPETQVIIAADKDISHGKVISVIDIIKINGIHKFAISIDKTGMPHPSDKE